MLESASNNDGLITRMRREDQEQREQQKIEAYTTAPAGESLIDVKAAQKHWSKEMASNPEFVRQVEERAKFNERLDAVIAGLKRPDISLQQAVAEGELTEEQVANLYDSLNILLAPGSEYQRILLYLPFEFLPGKGWKPKSSDLKREMETFKQQYMTAWRGLLTSHDVRSNFVDGDVTDFTFLAEGDPDPRVVKAAHLIPKLVEKGLLSLEEVFVLIEESTDQVLQKSIVDTLPVLQDMGLIHPGWIDRMERSYSPLLFEQVKVLQKLAGEEKPEIEQVGVVSFESITTQLEADLEEVDRRDHGEVTANREKWIRREEKRSVIEKTGRAIASGLESDRMDRTEAMQFFSEEVDQSAQEAFLDGLRQAIEMRAKQDPDAAKRLYSEYQEVIETHWLADGDRLRDAFSKLFFHLQGLGVITEADLKRLGLKRPALAGPFSENAKNMQEEIAEVVRSLEVMERDPVLKERVYPVVLVLGSRIKGYGLQNSDVDIAVFIKPGVDIEDTQAMRKKFKEVFSHKLIEGEVIEYWLEEDGDSLLIRNFDNQDVKVGFSVEIAFLFSSMWEGDPQMVKQLREKILGPYFEDNGRMFRDMDARRLELEDVERNLLQYRLMHTGYARYMPPFGGLDTQHAASLDGQSAFWDSGYRQTATQLFARNVFLPKIEK